MDSAHGHDDIQKQIKIYITIFVILAILTLVTVGVSYLHLPVREAVTLALIIATIKGSLVACYFMHLISEKKLIYAVLSVTIMFLLGLVILLLFGYHDIQFGAHYVS